jgi:predicted metal-binding protein
MGCRILDALADARIHSVRRIPARDIEIRKDVIDACGSCSYHGKSWSCPPARPRAPDPRSYKEALLVRFSSFRDREALEDAALMLESAFRASGFPRAFAYFVSPCTACPECSYPRPCRKPSYPRPTAESMGTDLIETARRAGVIIEKAGKGEDFRPVSLVLLQ